MTVTNPSSGGGAAIPDALFSGAIPGQYYGPRLSQGPSGTSTTTFTRLNALPILLRAGTLVEIAATHFGTPTAGEVLRLGIYEDDGTGYPGALLLDAGTIDLSTAAATKGITISRAVESELYWLASVKQGPTNAAVLLTYGAELYQQTGVGMPTDLGVAQPRTIGFRQAGVAGALPANFTATPAAIIANEGTTPVIGIKY